MADIERVIPWSGVDTNQPEPFLSQEWLVTNGLGGYASGTVSGVITRRYHGLLIAALPSPHGRVVMLNNLFEVVTLPDGTRHQLGGEERLSCSLQMRGSCFLGGFALEMGLPVWLYRFQDITIEKRLFLRYRQNTVQMRYTVSGDTPIRLELRPCIHFRSHHDPLAAHLTVPYSLTISGPLYEVSSADGLPPLRMVFDREDVRFTVDMMKVEGFIYRTEESLGYEGREDLWSPGFFYVNLPPDNSVTMVASTESREIINALTPAQALDAETSRRQFLIGSAHVAAQGGPAAELVLAADQFIVVPVTRHRDASYIQATGDEARTVIAGYHWFTDWGRDTMISLEGLALVTRRYLEAGWIIRTFSHYIRNGLIPNTFPEAQEQARYNTADATLWFFHAIDRYIEHTGDRVTLRFLLPKLLDIVAHHVRGTDYGIGVDTSDGLLYQGRNDYNLPLTWMDAKVGDWVVTPRRGKAVEINALWYNALRLMEQWLHEENMESEMRKVAQHADQCRTSFNNRFWYEKGGYLYDIIDLERGSDTACRPNQVLSISLRYPILDQERWSPVMKVVQEQLLTPVGLRSLAPDHPDFKPRYFGDIRARDAAYHQGTVWAWLIGPFIDAWLKLHPDDKAGARRFLQGLTSQLSQACIGTISEIFDAEEPYTPRGCIAQAWSVAEALRCWVKTQE